LKSGQAERCGATREHLPATIAAFTPHRVRFSARNSA
jgi:hypothetical protein